MSKMRPSWTVPSAENYVKSVLYSVGYYTTRTPYFTHSILAKVLSIVPEGFYVKGMYQQMSALRKRALRKKELKKN